ncbi:MAG TPA: DEAD/DEAH box helicase [Sphingomonadaceae bacterium]|nr:DEAD/DEAH box helicase [Sphingomonadaceae bacterium]
MTQFTDLGLSGPILQALAAADYDTPTPIQAQAIPLVLQGKDLLGIAQTGTGKTAAFTLPSLDILARANKRPGQRSCRMLVLSPTRELASQIADNATRYARFLPINITTAFGGVPIGKQQRALAGGVDILVATPGRLIDLIENRMLSLDKVEILVLDEADQMMDLGFIHALRRIVGLLPRQRQTLFFSATMPSAIKDLAGKFLKDPVQVAVTPVASTAEKVEQRGIFVNQPEKQALLTLTLRNDREMERVLIFSRTKHGADRIVKLLSQSGIPANAIHGNKSQPQRERSLAEFRSGKAKILVATDIAARGIDVTGVSHVVNFDMPPVPEQYVHRIGRTARAGAAGVAISFIAPDERPYLKGIERLTGSHLKMLPLPDNFIQEANRVKATRVSTPEQVAEETREANRPATPQRRRKAPQQPRGPLNTHRARRRASQSGSSQPAR